MLKTPINPEIGSASAVVETVDNVSAFRHLNEEWTELLRSSNSDRLFLTWEWLFTWWKHLAENRRLSVLTVRESGELIALAPLCLKPATWSRARPFSTTQFLGTGHVGSDYLDLIVRAGREQQAEQILTDHLVRLRETLHWTQIEKSSSSAARVAGRLNAKHWRIGETKTNLCPFISLASHTWESYLDTLGSEQRYNFRRKWRRLNRDFNVSFDQAATAEHCREAIDVVFALHELRRHDRGGSDAFHTPELKEFHREFSATALDRGWLRLYILRLNGRPVACLYGFLYRRRFYFYQSGFDPAYEKYSVGLVLMGLTIQRATEEGAVEYDLLHGAEDYKWRWTRQARELIRLELDPPGIRGWVSSSTIELARSAKRAFLRNSAGSTDNLVLPSSQDFERSDGCSRPVQLQIAPATVPPPGSLPS